ncbi:MAG: FeoA family protein [Actinomycetota bacterium]|nr:FeoA family protein [Actinomycetota bacterium]
MPGSRTPQPLGAQRPLAEVVEGDRVCLARISEEVEMDTDALIYLDEHRFVPGSDATVVSRAPDGTLMLATQATSVAIGADLSRRLYVTLRRRV